MLFRSPTGAPPEGIRDETDANDLAFPVHTAHVEDTDVHSAFACTQCHDDHSSIFDDGHLFDGDSTPGVAEVVFDAGLSDAGSWSGNGCSNLYCHGTGTRDDGSVDADEDVGYGDCHDTTLSENTDLTGRHDDHFEEGVSCEECHASVVSSNHAISDITLHVNGPVDVELTSGMTYASGRCTGTCHGESHRNEDW